MKNLLELGKEVVLEMKNQYRDSFYKYVDEHSLPDDVYISVGKELFCEKNMFMDYMNYKYLTDFDWLKSEVNSFDFIQDLVHEKIEGSKKYYWHETENMFIPIIEYSECLNVINEDNLAIPCIIRNSATNKSIYIVNYGDVYCDCNNGYLVMDMNDENQKDIFLEDGVDNIYEYLDKKLNPPIIELNGTLNLYFEVDSNRWKVEDEDVNMLDIETGEMREVSDIFISCLDELIESNPEILKKYGLTQIVNNVHSVIVQEV